MMDRTKLSSDAVAVALVAAARITGEDPERFVDRHPDFRCRHFALHALMHCFRSVGPLRISMALGCPGKANYFFRSSLWWTLGQNPHGTKKRAEWWSDESLGLVIAALEAHLGGPAPVEEDDTEEAPPRPRRRVELAAQPAVPDLPESPDALVRRPPPFAEGKRSLYDLMAEAARNTAALPKEG